MVDWRLRFAAWLLERTTHPVGAVPPAVARRQLRAIMRCATPVLAGWPVAVASVEDRVLAGVPTRIYRPYGASARAPTVA